MTPAVLMTHVTRPNVEQDEAFIFSCCVALARNQEKCWRRLRRCASSSQLPIVGPEMHLNRGQTSKALPVRPRPVPELSLGAKVGSQAVPDRLLAAGQLWATTDTGGPPTEAALIHLAAKLALQFALFLDVLLDHLAQIILALSAGGRGLPRWFFVSHGGILKHWPPAP